MGKEELDQIIRAVDNRFDDMQVKWAKTQKQIVESMKVVDAARNDDNAEIAGLTQKIDELNVRMIDGNESDGGIRFKSFGDDNLDPLTWWRNFEACADFRNYDADRRISALKALLKGSAAVWLESTLAGDEYREITAQEKLDNIKAEFLKGLKRTTLG